MLAAAARAYKIWKLFGSAVRNNHTILQYYGVYFMLPSWAPATGHTHSQQYTSIKPLYLENVMSSTIPWICGTFCTVHVLRLLCAPKLDSNNTKKATEKKPHRRQIKCLDFANQSALKKHSHTSEDGKQRNQAPNKDLPLEMCYTIETATNTHRRWKLISFWHTMLTAFLHQFSIT